ncbi:ABC transporter permease [Spongiimicrobium salis]|uniref:ABC transporter permease n=1 Tax=Spongiimicrobium salis TaxID=1667022 RepID=UPI00374DE8DC
MKFSNVKLFASHFFRNATRSKVFYGIGILFILLTVYAAVSGIQNYVSQHDIHQQHQLKARQSWEANPDKHPHRMAHFGTFAFRISSPLSLFDYGLESFTGNAVFLEAHRQNSVNFSEASFSTGTLRFGALSMALLLQLVLPLILIFVGFSSIAADRRNGTLKILIAQNASWLDILLGKSLGLFGIALLFVVPVLVVVAIALLLYGGAVTESYLWSRFLFVVMGYIGFLGIVANVVILISASATAPKDALLRLLGIWLLMVVLLPKSTQALGSYQYPTPTKLAFQSAIEKEVIRKGDSHNPNDPYYNDLRDSVLAVHKVSKVTDLPFNYAGFVMREGEKISADLYKKHYAGLLENYENQNKSTRLIALINPYMAIKQLSMTFSGTDFLNYVDFQEQADTYRYALSQKMNNLQMQYISPKRESGSEGKTHVVGHEHWEEFPDFKHEPMPFKQVMNEAIPALVSLVLWVFLSIGLLLFTAKRAKAL